MLIVDASILAPVVADAGNDGRRFRERIRNETIMAPDLLRLEVVSVLRRHAAGGLMTGVEVDRAAADLAAFPIVVFPTAPLVGRIWELRHNLSPYDAAYVALAEATDRPLVTADRRLATAPGVQCAVEVL